MNVPQQYTQLMPYLIVNRAAEFSEFMKKVFDATEQSIVSSEDNLVRHGELRIGEAVVMIADAIEKYPPRPASLFIYVENVADTYKKAMDAGATSTMEPTERDYGYTCGFTDPFGNEWWPCQAPA